MIEVIGIWYDRIEWMGKVSWGFMVTDRDGLRRLHIHYKV